MLAKMAEAISWSSPALARREPSEFNKLYAFRIRKMPVSGGSGAKQEQKSEDSERAAFERTLWLSRRLCLPD